MPGTAATIFRWSTLGFCLVTVCGCLTNSAFYPAGNAIVLPPEHLIDGNQVVYQPPVMPVSNSPVSVAPTSPGDITLVSGIGNSPSGEPGTIAPDAQSTAALPDLGHIYGRTAQADDRDRNPIIVIPGVLGSRLVDDQARMVVWGEFGGDGINPGNSVGARLIALPMAQGQPLNTLRDNVRAAGTLDALSIRVLGIPFQIKAYRDLLITLGVGGYRDSQSNLANIDYANQSYSSFQFAYDWRRDNVENARLLHQFILEKKQYIESERRKRYGNDVEPVRFDIVAHSMGGLVARYYLQYGDTDLPSEGTTPNVTWAGAEHVARLVMVATPNAGSLDTVHNLVHGETLSRFLPRYEAAILGTMPSLYQLLPRSRQKPVVAEGDHNAVDLLNPTVWAQFRWGLLDPRQQLVLRELLPGVDDPNVRQQIAYEHLSKCLNRARAFQTAMDAPATPPEGTTIHLIAGDANPTVAQYRVDQRGALTVTGSKPGDGRVCRSSALMDERFSVGSKWSPRLISPIKWASVNFLFADHLKLTSDPGFTDNILYLLLESPR